MKDCDPTTGIPDSDEGYDDEYMLEDFDVIVADQVKKTKINNFTAAWDSADSDGKDYVEISTASTINIVSHSLLEWVELEETYQLATVHTLQEAVQTIIKFLGLASVNNTERVAEGSQTHALMCSGKFIVAILLQRRFNTI